jgi:hypothetical protein
MIRITSSKYRNKIQNGDNFSLNSTMFNERLDGNVGEVVQWEVELELAKIYISSQAFPFIISADGTDWILESSENDLENEDVRIGDTFELYSDVASGTYATGYSGTVTWVNRSQIGFTATLGTPAAGSLTDQAINFDISTEDVLDYTYSLNEQGNFQSPIDLQEQQYTFNGIVGASGLPATIKSSSSTWSYALPTITEGTLITAPYDKRVFTIVHEFVLNPYGTEDIKGFILSPNQPTYFNKDLKFNTRFELRKNTGDGVSLSEEVIRDAQVGFFDRVFNNSDATINVTNLVYLDEADLTPVDGIQTSRATRITFDIEDVNLTGYTFNFIYSCLPQQTEYQNRLTTYPQTWQYENFRTLASGSDTGVIVSANITTGTTNSFVVVINPTIENSVNVNVNNQYLMALQLWDSNTLNANRPIHPIVTGDYYKNNDIAGLLTWDSFRIFPHNNLTASEGNTAGFTDYNGYSQDSIAFRANFTLNAINNLNPEVRKVRIGVQIKNTSTNEDFELNGYDIAYAPSVNSYGQNLVESDTNVGYQLLTTDPNNISKITFLSDTASTVSEQLDSAIRIQWQEWNALKDAINEYFDNSLEQQGRNKDGSRYWSAANTEVYLQITIGLFADNSLTDYVLRSAPLTIQEDSYELDWLTNMVVTDVDGNNLGGQIIKGEDAIIQTTHTLAVGSIDPEVDFDVIHSFERPLSSSEYGLIQASTKRSFNSSLIKSITQTKSTASIITKTLLDGNQIGGNWNLYSRLLTDYVDVPLPLDGLTAAGFSPRKLRKAYTGFGMRIQNQLSPIGATFLDVGFDGVDCDVNAIIGLVGAQNPFWINKFYNQGVIGGDIQVQAASLVMQGQISNGKVYITRDNAVEPRLQWIGSAALFTNKFPHIIIDAHMEMLSFNDNQAIMGTKFFGGVPRTMGWRNAGGGQRKGIFRDNVGFHFANPAMASDTLGNPTDTSVWSYKKRASDGLGVIDRKTYYNAVPDTQYLTSVVPLDWLTNSFDYYAFGSNTSADAWRADNTWRDLFIFPEEQTALIQNAIVDDIVNYYG